MQSEFRSWVFERLLSDGGRLLDLGSRNRPTAHQAVDEGTEIAAGVLHCPLAFTAVQTDAGGFDIEVVKMLPAWRGIIPRWCSYPPFTPLLGCGFVLDVVQANRGRTLEPDDSDVLNEREITSAVGAPLHLPDNRRRILVVCNRPTRYRIQTPRGAVEAVAYPDAHGDPAQLFGTLDRDVLQTLAWMIEHAY